MASFEEAGTDEAWKVYRPSESAKENPRAWWRYSILAEIYKVRCFQRAETWRIAGNKGMNLLSHIRVLVAEHGSLEGVDLTNISESYLNDTAGKLKALEGVVQDLNRENMTLRKLIKALLTPAAKQSFAEDLTTLQFMETQIAQFDNYMKLHSPKKLDSPRSPRSKSASPDQQVIEAERLAAAEDQLIDALVDSIESPDLNLRSPYEKVLPPIELTEKDMRESPKAKRGSKPASLRAPKPRAVPEKDKFPSYLEREAMRKEAARKKKEEVIKKKAELLLQHSAVVDNEQKPTLFLPVLPVKLSPRSEIPSRSPSAAAGLEQGSVSDVASVGSKAERRKDGGKSQKQLLQPPWVDDVRVVDPLVGRGKGKAREVSDGAEAASALGSKKSSRAQVLAQGSAATIETAGSAAPAGGALPSASSAKVLYPEPTADMTEGEKLTVELISKARAKMLTAEEAKKPLTSTEKALLKSPLALPLVKPMPGDEALSPRSKSYQPTTSSSKIFSSQPSPGAVKTSPSPRIPSTSSPRSPQKTPLSGRSLGSKGAEAAAMESHSAPATVTAPPVPPPQPTLPEPTTPAMSPSKEVGFCEKAKKKSVLKALNEKSNPNSPRIDAQKNVGSRGESAEEPSQSAVDSAQLEVGEDHEVEKSLAQSLSAAFTRAALASVQSEVSVN